MSDKLAQNVFKARAIYPDLEDAMQFNQTSNFKSRTRRMYQTSDPQLTPGVGAYNTSSQHSNSTYSNVPDSQYQFRQRGAIKNPPFMIAEQRFRNKEAAEKSSFPGPNLYQNETHSGMDEKTWKVLNSENLRNVIKITVSHQKLINAGFIKNNKAIYNNSDEPRFKEKVNKTSRPGPGNYENVENDWIKKSYNLKFM